MWHSIGSLDDWRRFLESGTDDDACSQLASYSRHLDQLHSELSQVVVTLYDSPTGDVADVLRIARTALAEAAGMLDSVRARFADEARASA